MENNQVKPGKYQSFLFPEVYVTVKETMTYKGKDTLIADYIDLKYNLSGKNVLYILEGFLDLYHFVEEAQNDSLP